MLYTSRLTIPKLCPLIFQNPTMATEGTFYPMCYTQKWVPNDSTKIQVWFADATPSEVFALEVFDEYGTCRGIFPFYWATLSAGYDYANAKLSFSGLSGIYEVRITSEESLYPLLSESTPVVGEYYVHGHNIWKYTGGPYNTTDPWIPTGGVEIATESLLDTLADSWPIEVGNHTDTFLIAYGNTRNDFETVFGDFDYDTFTFRIEGGFMPDGYEAGADFSLFTNQHQEDTLTYAMPFDTHTLTIGDSLGVPWYFLEKINHIFCCDITLVEWVQYTRTGDLEIEWTSKKTGIGAISLKTVTNRMTQNITGDIIITDESSVPLANEDDNILTL